jgi:hypothetical protein
MSSSEIGVAQSGGGNSSAAPSPDRWAASAIRAGSRP